MSVLSGAVVWIPIYALVLWQAYKTFGWRKTIAFLICTALAMGLADLFCGIFKHTGLLKDLWASFPARLRPMFTPEIRDLAHVPSFRHGLYGTVSAHAATISSFVFLSSATLKKKWVTWIGIAMLLIVCYSRIYLACHYPKDLFLGILMGCTAATFMYILFRMWLKTIDRCEKK